MFGVVERSIEVRLDHHTPDPLSVIERNARRCYQSEVSDDPEAFVRKLIQRGHESPLEFADFAFVFVVPRGISHELVRHRICSILQQSTRYCSVTSYIRPFFKHQESHAIWEEIVTQIEQAYRKLMLLGESKQTAREVLPNCLATELVIKANAREWRHILSVRNHPAAHPQMQHAMQYIDIWFKENFPVLVS